MAPTPGTILVTRTLAAGLGEVRQLPRGTLPLIRSGAFFAPGSFPRTCGFLWHLQPEFVDGSTNSCVVAAVTAEAAGRPAAATTIGASCRSLEQPVAAAMASSLTAAFEQHSPLVGLVPSVAIDDCWIEKCTEAQTEKETIPGERLQASRDNFTFTQQVFALKMACKKARLEAISARQHVAKERVWRAWMQTGVNLSRPSKRQAAVTAASRVTALATSRATRQQMLRAWEAACANVRNKRAVASMFADATQSEALLRGQFRSQRLAWQMAQVRILRQTSFRAWAALPRRERQQKSRRDTTAPKPAKKLSAETEACSPCSCGDNAGWGCTCRGVYSWRLLLAYRERAGNVGDVAPPPGLTAVKLPTLARRCDLDAPPGLVLPQAQRRLSLPVNASNEKSTALSSAETLASCKPASAEFSDVVNGLRGVWARRHAAKSFAAAVA